jgi:V8-like Glu-specific endopeptidase
MHTRLGAAAFLLALTGSALSAPVDASLKELRQSFTLDHKPIPPEVFGDFGDSDIADSASIRVTIDLLAAMGSNLYYDDVAVSPEGWVTQKRQVPNGADKLTETTSYKFNGVTKNGLFVVTASFSGGGTGEFVTLHILDAAIAHAFDNDGKLYDRLNLTVLRSVPLGDRWDGSVKIGGNTIVIATAPREPKTNDRKPGVQTIEAVRP